MDFCIFIAEFDNIEKYIGPYYLFADCAYISCFGISEQGTLSYAAMFFRFTKLSMPSETHSFLSRLELIRQQAGRMHTAECVAKEVKSCVHKSLIFIVVDEVFCLFGN